MGQRDIGKSIAKLLFPDFVPEPDGSLNDKNGIDGTLNGKALQVKYNHRIVVSGNLYHEIYEKTAHRPSQPWRVSFSKAELYLFITEGERYYKGYLIHTDALAQAEKRKILTPINPNNGAETSLGFLLKLDVDINKYELKTCQKVIG